MEQLRFLIHALECSINLASFADSVYEKMGLLLWFAVRSEASPLRCICLKAYLDPVSNNEP